MIRSKYWLELRESPLFLKREQLLLLYVVILELSCRDFLRDQCKSNLQDLLKYVRKRRNCKFVSRSIPTTAIMKKIRKF